MELLIFEVLRFYEQQPYLSILYKALFLIAYYGMFRIGELTLSDHTVKAKDVHIATNKNRMLFILYSSKTHGRESHPQKIKIEGNIHGDSKMRTNPNNRFFCPFNASREYLAIRGNYEEDNEPFFIFADKQPVKPLHARKILKRALKSVNLNPDLYNFHSIRGGRTSQLVKDNFPISKVKIWGRWRSNAVYRYIKN